LIGPSADSARIRAAIFDMDGVLVDSEPLHLASANRALAPHGVRLTDEDNSAYLGWTEEAFWRAVVARFALPGSPEAYQARRAGYFFELLREDARVSPGVGVVLEALRSRGLRLGVASSSDTRMIAHVLAAGGLTRYFDAIAAGDEIRRSKPDPEIFLLAAARLAVRPEHCLVFEDSPHGIQAAVRAGMRCVRVVTDTTRALPCPPTDHVIEGFDGLDVSALPGIELAG
jgi:HAD superfamily hydrolase (TIGR01509 family)